MSFFIRISLLIFLFCCSFNSIYSQELWTSAAINIKANKRFSTQLEQQVRMVLDPLLYDQTFTEITLKYKFFDHIAIKSGYRYVFTEENKQRIYGDLAGDIGSNKTRFVFSTRLRYQSTFNKIETDNYLRQNFGLYYNFTKSAVPFIVGELFYKLNDPREFRTFRRTFGIQINASKRIKLTAFYRVDQEFNVKRPEKTYIVGFNTTYKLKLISKNEESKDPDLYEP